MAQRRCACNKPIPPFYSLCIECREKYGNDRISWPPWLLHAVNDHQREFKSSREFERRTLSYYDDYDYSDISLGHEHTSLIRPRDTEHDE